MRERGKRWEASYEFVELKVVDARVDVDTIDHARPAVDPVLLSSHSLSDL